ANSKLKRPLPAFPHPLASLAALAALAVGVAGDGLAIQDPPASSKGGGESWDGDPPDLASLVDFQRRQSELRTAVERYAEDRGVLLRRYDVDYSSIRRERMRAFYEGCASQLAGVDFSTL